MKLPRSVKLYDLSYDKNIPIAELEKQLQAKSWEPCPKHAIQSLGWISPYPEQNASFLAHCNQWISFLLCIEKKVLPRTVVKQYTQTEIENLEKSSALPLSKKDRSTVQEEIRYKLLSQAFTIKTYHPVIIDLKRELLLIPPLSEQKQQLLSQLFLEIPWIKKISPITVNMDISLTMRQWLLEKNLPQQLSLSKSCAIQNIHNQQGKITFFQEDLSAQSLLKDNLKDKEVRSLELESDQGIRFTLDADFKVSKIQMLEPLLESIKEINTPCLASQIDANILIWSAAIMNVLTSLIASLGGKQETKDQEKVYAQ